jgi:hypothetical protein
MHDVIVVDEEFTDHSNGISQLCTELGNVVADYLSIMSDASTLGTISGNVSEAMAAFVSVANEMQQMIEDVKTKNTSAVQSFLVEMDAADQFLY